MVTGSPVKQIYRIIVPGSGDGVWKKPAEEQALLRQVIDTLPGFISVKDENGCFRLVNRAFAAARGATADELIGKTTRDLNFDEEGFSRAQRQDPEVIRYGDEELIDGEPITFADRTVHWISEYKAPLFDPDGECRSVLTVGTDITGRKEAEAEKEKKLIKTRKTEARGIIHDFNNILMGLQSHISILLYDLSPDHPHRLKLEHMESYISRGMDLSKQLMRFALGGSCEVENDLPEKSAGQKHLHGQDTKGAHAFQPACRRPPEHGCRSGGNGSGFSEPFVGTSSVDL
jgi:PAS domain S-box-containing protein